MYFGYCLAISKILFIPFCSSYFKANSFCEFYKIMSEIIVLDNKKPRFVRLILFLL